MYDVIIVGLGPAAISAAIYASRYNMKVLVIGAQIGGMVSITHLVDNYPGLPNITGADLSQKLLEHASKFQNCEIKYNSVTTINKVNDIISVSTENGEVYEGKSIILALGTDKKKADIKGEKEFTGRGVSYCTVCDGMFYRNKIASVVGSGNSAVKGAHHLAHIAEKVYLIIRKDKLSADDQFDVDSVLNEPKIEIIKNSQISEIKGSNKVESINIKTTLEDGTFTEKEMKMDGVFIEIGTIPHSVLFKDLGVETNEYGFIKIDQYCKTNIDKVYAAGDITTGFSDLKQIVVAEAMGAVAATTAKKYLK